MLCPGGKIPATGSFRRTTLPWGNGAQEASQYGIVISLLVRLSDYLFRQLLKLFPSTGHGLAYYG